MTILNQRENQNITRVYLDTSLNLIELFVNDIVEINYLPNFEAYSIMEKADVHSIVFVKSQTNFYKIYESLSNIYDNVELRLDESSKMLIKFLERSMTVELLLVEHPDIHHDV